MRRFIAIAIGLIFPATCFTQIIYIDLCDVSCSKCSAKQPLKIEFKVDKSTNTVLRIMDDALVNKLDACSIIDSKNWTCESFNTNYSINGNAYFNFYKEITKPNEYKCYFEKNIFGKLVARKISN